MQGKWIILLTLVLVIGCGQQVHFIQVGNEKYLPKAKDYDIQVFFIDDPPKREYEIIGKVFFEDDSGLLSSYLLTHPKIINRLK